MPIPRRFDRRPPERDTTRINERIRVPEVRLIDESGQQVGVMRTDEALRYAQERDLDLVEVVDARPCCVLDYSKYKYEQAQKQKSRALTPAADHDPRDQVPPEDRPERLRHEEGPRRPLPQAQGPRSRSRSCSAGARWPIPSAA
ncbi:MAG: translation initiation factor IF-3 [Solirubrobacteraceae bacterium]